jgi:hypothetical protein
MFVRFRKQGHRLGVSLMQTRRVDGKVQSEHVASLGSVDDPPSVRERFAFWAALPDRLDRLGNRLAARDQPKIYEVVHARIPMATPDDQRTIQEENAKDDERFWGLLRGLNEDLIEGHKALIATAEAKNAEIAPVVADASEKEERAKDRLARLERGEAVSGGLGKRLDMEALLDQAGVSKRLRRRAILLASLTDEELKALEVRSKEFIAAHHNAHDRAARKILRARRAP